ncbi:unnamed protein product [Prunus armeniaca]
MRYLKLSKDLEEFQKCPWGIVSYAKTNASFFRALCADYHRTWAFEVFPALTALYFVVHEENDHIPRILQWKNNTSACFHELMSQVFENCEAYWSWGDNDENTEEIIEFFADEAQENTSTSVEVKDDEVEETTTLPSSSKGKLLSTELRTLKRKFQTTKDELAKVANSN